MPFSQMYVIVTRYFYTAQNDPYGTCNYHLSPYEVMTLLLAIVPLLLVLHQGNNCFRTNFWVCYKLAAYY